MEDTDQELVKHVCKLCSKSFPCGRSLGGHMRSHVINSSDHQQQKQKKKLSSVSNTTVINASSNSNDSVYELRKDPKKTLKAKDSSEVDNSSSCLVVLDKLCKECGKGFQSWKALFGHMKCHSDKVSNNNNNNHHSTANLGQDSWTCQSDNENSGSKNRRIKRSRSRNRTIKRYIVASATTATVTTTNTTATTASSSISMTANNNNNQISSNNASTSVVSEIEQEQEVEIAMCLMMLSRDVRKWGNFQTESSAFVEANVGKLTKAEGLKPRNGFKMKKLADTQVGVDFLGRSEVGFDGVEKIVIKSDEFDDQSELGLGKFEDSNKRKFECTTCNKSFHSYQALGGHRASHKKLKGCFDLKIEAENKIENEPMFDHERMINGIGEKISENHQTTSSFNLGGSAGGSKKAIVLGEHECPICLRIFSSGQALGGHKRSHLVAEAKLNQQNSIAEIVKAEEPVHEIRGFLDLNMPPATSEQEEMIMSSSTIEYKPWYWAESSNHHNHEPTLLGLLSTS